uniref:Uncharacterized protein n=1 Tax=Tanacetum cinerariifolium TaxID=118510 RepID=A0A6L2LK93_TANCI|nr:hypothetical protein [Tanacetum cinerariifolium]
MGGKGGGGGGGGRGGGKGGGKGITSIAVDRKNDYELKGKFLDDFHNNAFSGTNGEYAVKHIEYFLRIVDPIDLPNVNHDKLRVVVFPISLVGDAWRCDEIEATNEESFGLKETNNDDEHEIDSELKDEALRNKAIMEGMIDDNDESSNNGWKRWKGYKIANHDQEENENENEYDNEERYEMFNNATRELPVCTIRRFEMIKYSFGDDEEYVDVKEDEYDDLTNTRKDACRTYQKIFRMMDEGWMVTRAE